MKFSTYGLSLNISPHSSANEEEWAKINVSVEVSGFSGSSVAWIQISDLKRFCEELKNMNENLGENTSAKLCSAEPDIDLELKMNHLGQIEGTFYLESQRSNDGVPTCLSCGFKMDQSFVPGLILQVELLTAQLTENKAF